ncbi:hypothetical protein L598_000700001010 [Mesorhizobium sp. J18]|uniref:hypothetical protein n=1 Tax=Mesorhizobium sp. J18 TaxID=935263 RepID=UPI00119B2CE5|nr:hypothetical protein [Mesorhizobium sp. J18]TWG90344.1 hypothetical protein L598_000700001010 [Mesorhizobium sp. J18]
MIRWRAPSYSGDRRVALAGRVEIGAVFPPLDKKGWAWRLWITGSVCSTGGFAPSELGAKTALDRAWADFLNKANLREAA